MSLGYNKDIDEVVTTIMFSQVQSKLFNKSKKEIEAQHKVKVYGNKVVPEKFKNSIIQSEINKQYVATNNTKEMPRVLSTYPTFVSAKPTNHPSTVVVDIKQTDTGTALNKVAVILQTPPVLSPPAQRAKSSQTECAYSKVQKNSLNQQLRNSKDVPEKSKRNVTAVKVRHILCENREKCVEAIKRLKSGQNFTKVADVYNEGKKEALGWLTSGGTDPEFEKAAFALSVSTVNNPAYTLTPVKTNVGYHIIMIEGKV